MDAPADLPRLADALQACRRCDLWRDATQSVPGEGPRRAAIMLVGEQPGDQEDLQGHPFVGPAGRLLDRALAAAGVRRDAVFVTNSVKHFKHERRGKRRLHKRPDAGEIAACRFWLDAERALVQPRVIVAMGASAVLAVFGRTHPVMRCRGRLMPLAEGAQGLITVHPAFLLRLPERAGRAAAFADFVRDLHGVRSFDGQGRA